MNIYLEMREDGKRAHIETEIDGFLLGLCHDKAKFITDNLGILIAVALEKMKTEQEVSIGTEAVKQDEEDR